MTPNVTDPGRIVAHRGASMARPENTLSAFRAAHDQGAFWVEFDVSVLGDGTAVVHHDATLERCTDATGPLSAISEQDLERIRVGGTEALPTLDQALDLIHDLGFYANLEIKCHDIAPGIMAETVARALTSRPWTKTRIVTSSFQHDALRALRGLMPQAPLAVLYDQPAEGWLKTVADLNAAALHLHFTHLSESLLKDARRAQLDVRVFTINEAGLLVAFRDMGLTGVMTDHPPIFLGDPGWAAWAEG
ncbi:MAG: glycerophosphodiester phosphodiesterase family protein [Pseudomonadota bacterium]